MIENGCKKKSKIKLNIFENNYAPFKLVIFQTNMFTDPCKGDNGYPLSSAPFEKPGDCSNFYQCGAGVLYTMPCAPGTAFNPVIGVCDWPYNVPGCATLTPGFNGTQFKNVNKISVLLKPFIFSKINAMTPTENRSVPDHLKNQAIAIISTNAGPVGFIF